MKAEDTVQKLVKEGGSCWEALGQTIRRLVKVAIEETVEEERSEALAAAAYAREAERRGYRNGSRPRELATSVGPVRLELPRARLFGPGGPGGERTAEWESRLLPRYARRAPDVDAALLGCYLSGVNTRKVKAALRPLLRGAPLSKSAVSRLVARLAVRFEEWRGRSLTQEDVVYLILDGFGVKVRLGKRVVSVPVLAALGIKANGEKVLLALELAGAEATASWEGLIRDLEARGLRAPILAIVDGNKGLLRALEMTWPKTKIQRCTVHKARNLMAKAPAHLREQVAADYKAFIYAASPEAVRAGYERFLGKYDRLCAPVAASLREAGPQLLTFTEFPRSQWKSLRTTNTLERLNGEFRRRVKTQGSFPNDEAVVVLLFGLVDAGIVRMRRMDGWRQMPEVVLAHGRQAA